MYIGEYEISLFVKSEPKKTERKEGIKAGLLTVIVAASFVAGLLVSLFVL